jgi:thiamine pyrophosphate-dependent acetolactate synthase large subunit-like protein
MSTASGGIAHDERPLARTLIAQAVAHETDSPVFGLLGSANMRLMADLMRQGQKIVNVHHENMAIAMADGYFRSTGAVGLATVTLGPGLTQIGTNLMVAARRHSSLVILAGDSLAHVGSKSLNAMDERAFVEAAGGTFVGVRGPDTVLDDVRHAFYLARSLPAPVVLGIPVEHQAIRVDQQPYSPSSALVRASNSGTVDPAATRQAADMLRSAQRPVIIAGRGAMSESARTALISLAEATGALLATTLPAKGIFEGVDFNLGVVGGYGSYVGTSLLQHSDLVLGFGMSFSHHTTQGDAIFRQARVISVTTDGASLVSDSRAADVVVRADAAATAQLLRSIVDEQGPSAGTYRTDQVAQLLTADLRLQEIAMDPATPESGTVDPRLLVMEVEANLPQQCRFVICPSHSGYFPSRFLTGGEGKEFVTTTEFAAIGHGLSTGIGASFAGDPTTTVVFEGDGAVIMNVQELHTAALYGAHVLLVIMNDEGFGTEFHRLTDDPEGYALAQTPSPNFAALAESMNVPAVTVTDLHQVAPAVRRFAQGAGPMVIDARINRTVIRPVPMGRVVLDLAL